MLLAAPYWSNILSRDMVISMIYRKIKILYLGLAILGATCAKSQEDAAGSAIDCGNRGRVTYNANGATSGTVPPDQCVGVGSIFYVSGNVGNLARSGYAFQGWNGNAAGTGATYSGSYQALSNGTLTLYAKWVPAYSVTYNGNGNTGGTVPTDSNNYVQGATVTTLKNPGGLVKTGFAFAGWNTNAAGTGTNYMNGATFPMGNANVILYAKWSTPYTITYDGNGNTGGSAPVDNNVYATGIQVVLAGNTGAMVKTGLEFLGWNTLANGSGTDYFSGASITMGSSNLTLFAKWGYKNRTWRSVASSADGTKLVAVAGDLFGEKIYTSTDSGATWTARDPARDWYSVASSSDGTKLVAVEYLGRIYTSTDSGVTWTARDSARKWYSVASSSDGTKLVAVEHQGHIYTSTDSGVTWTARDSARDWYSVASSSDGTKLVAVVRSGQIYTSTDSGVTWTPRDSARSWVSVASSSDGTKLVAVAYLGRIYTSTDSGVTWTAREGTRAWSAVTSSSDGVKLVAVETDSISFNPSGGQVYTSTDSGVTWTVRDSVRKWSAVTSSADGSITAAVVVDGFLYISSDSGVNWAAKL
jgi:uncharacterized repeat protein (TIGR02543 family)